MLQERTKRASCGLIKGYVRELTGLVRCSHCGRHMSYQHHVRLGPIYLRCTYFRCPGEKRNRIKVQVVKDAIWQKLQAHKEPLLAYVIAQAGMFRGQVDEAVRLDAEIRELEARNDPDLTEAILRKRMKLQTVAQIQGHRLDVDMSTVDMRRALTDPAYWTLVQGDIELTRRMFTDWVQQVLVRERAVEAVTLKLEGCGAISSLGLG